MKHRSLLCMLLALLLFLPALNPTCAEDTVTYRFFDEPKYVHFSCTAKGCELELDAVFFADGYFLGLGSDGLEAPGCYALRSDGTLLLDIGSIACELVDTGSATYAAALPDNAGTCLLTPIDKAVFHTAAEHAGIDCVPEYGRTDLLVYDALIYGTVTAPEGVDMTVQPAWSNIVAGHAAAGTRVILLGEDSDGLLCWIDAEGVLGFVPMDSVTSEQTMIARVVRSSSKDKGRTVNVRSTPEYGDNVLDEIPYGERVVVYPVVVGEFTQVLLDDYTVGWMTTVRLEILDDPYGE